MARLPRVTQTIFASSASNNGVFGSAQDGSKIISNSLATLMSKPAWVAGWLSAVLGGSKFPPLEEFQALSYIETTQLAYIFQEGIPEYDAGTTYFTNSVVKQAGTYQLYGSRTNNNTGNLLTDTANWQALVNLQGFVPLTGPITYHVDASTGNDSTGNGTVSLPWRTLNFAYNYVVNNIYQNGFTVTIQCANFTNAPGFQGHSPFDGPITIDFGGGSIQGNTGIPVVNLTGSGYSVTIQNGTLGSIDAAGGLIAASLSCDLVIGASITFGACPQIQIYALRAAVHIAANCTISGSAVAFAFSDVQGYIETVGTVVITLSGTPAYSTAFAQAISNGAQNWHTGLSFAGTGATGTRYVAAFNGTIAVFGAGATFLPGNAGGTTATGGQYA